MCSVLAVRSYRPIDAYIKILFYSLRQYTDNLKPHILATNGDMANMQAAPDELNINSIHVSDATVPISLFQHILKLADAT